MAYNDTPIVGVTVGVTVGLQSDENGIRSDTSTGVRVTLKSDRLAYVGVMW